MALNAETGARIEVSGQTALLLLTVESGGSFNALSGGRGFVAERVRPKAAGKPAWGFAKLGLPKSCSKQAGHIS